MKILGISGSHRTNGNTEILVKRALDVCKNNGSEAEFVGLADKKVGYCTDCNYCIKENQFQCPQDDDVQEILNKMAEADAIIIGSPTYFSCVSARLKALFDRSLPLRRDNCKLSEKVGGAIAVGGSRNGGQEFVTMAIHNWMLLQEMVVVSDKKTAHFGGIAVGRKSGDVLNDAVGLQTVENLALKVIETVKRIK